MKKQKYNLLTIAAAVVLSGVSGGVIGQAATTVVAYDQLAKEMAALDTVVQAEGTENVKAQTARVVGVFQALDENAKGAWKQATTKPKR
jgi:hypothetical protein